MPRFRAWAVGTAAVTIAGCSLTTDLTGFSNGAGASGEGGTAPTTSDGAAGPTDASTATDGEATVSGDAAEPSSDCTGAHFFCTDFDKQALADEWNVVTPGSGTLERNMAASFSMPFSLVMTHPGGVPQATPKVTKTLPATAIGGLRCRFRYRRDKVDPDGVLVILVVDFNTATSEHLFVEIKDGDSNGRVYLNATQPDGGSIDDFPTVPTFSTALGSWASVDWTLDLRALRSTLKSDTKVIDQRPIPNFDVSRVNSIGFSLGLGNFSFVPASSPWQVRYDDFVCDTLP